jgi:hypothetical protein
MRTVIEPVTPPSMAFVYGKLAATHSIRGHDGQWWDCDACHDELRG